MSDRPPEQGVEGTVPAQWYLDLKSERDALLAEKERLEKERDELIALVRDFRHALEWERDGGEPLDDTSYHLLLSMGTDAVERR